MTRTDDDDWSRSSFSVSVAGRPADQHAPRRAPSFGGGGGRDNGPGDWLRGFLRRYGWRAVALPVLLVVTVVALLTTGDGKTSPKPAQGSQGTQGSQDTQGGSATAGPSTTAGGGAVDDSTPPSAPQSIALKSDDTGSVDYVAAVHNGELPAGPAYTKRGDGTFRVLPGSSPVIGSTGQLYRFDIEVENGISGVDLGQFAAAVMSTLSNPKSWSGHGVRIQRVPQAQADFRITLTSSLTVRQYCGYDIPIETSCYAKAYSVAGLTSNRVIFNVSRWVRGAGPFVGDLAAYRLYMINHEVGHALGHNHAHQCLPGGLAPVMMQQTIGLKSADTGKYCQANSWPYPPGAKGAPGAEQADTAQNSEFNLD